MQDYVLPEAAAAIVIVVLLLLLVISVFFLDRGGYKREATMSVSRVCDLCL